MLPLYVPGRPLPGLLGKPCAPGANAGHSGAGAPTLGAPGANAGHSGTGAPTRKGRPSERRRPAARRGSRNVGSGQRRHGGQHRIPTRRFADEVAGAGDEVERPTPSISRADERRQRVDLQVDVLEASTLRATTGERLPGGGRPDEPPPIAALPTCTHVRATVGEPKPAGGVPNAGRSARPRDGAAKGGSARETVACGVGGCRGALAACLLRPWWLGGFRGCLLPGLLACLLRLSCLGASGVVGFRGCWPVCFASRASVLPGVDLGRFAAASTVVGDLGPTTRLVPRG